MKLYVKPEAEEISLIAKEDVTSPADNDGIVDGDLGLGSNMFDQDDEEC